MESHIKKSEISTDTTSVDSNINNFYIVAIGASAGGLEALEQFFKPVHEKCKMAYIVIQHLDPNRKGMLPELLQRSSNLQVIEAKNGMFVMPGMVYVIPPNKIMSISKGVLYLKIMPVRGGGNGLPIDNFMISLAKDQKENAVGVVLSGMGTDGTLGAIAIKENNGTVMVQEPSDAKFDSMPNNAIAKVMEDIVAPASELADRLHGLLSYIPYLNQETKTEVAGDNILDKIIILLRVRTGNDFSQYKRKTTFRSIERRMAFIQINSLESYFYFIHEDNNEVKLLLKSFLIGVTSFFRDNKVWIKMKKAIIPGLLAKQKDDAVLRAWVAGCSTGEEAYSLAIVFKEIVESNEQFKDKTLQIFATDLDEESIEIARKGYYPASIAENVSQERLDRFFIKHENGYMVSPELRKNIVFVVHNINSHPPFTGIDILSCRNLLIYLDTELQQKLLGMFYFCIKPEGILLLGSSESIGIERDNFTPVDNLLKFYKRSFSTEKYGELFNFPKFSSITGPVIVEQIELEKSNQNIDILTNDILLKIFSPVSVLVNKNGDIIHISGHSGKYLEPSIGKANMNIYSMLRKDLYAEFKKAFQKAVTKNETVVLNILIGAEGEEQYTNVTIKWFDETDLLSGYLMIVFFDLPKIAAILPGKNKGEDTTDNIRVLSLQNELEQTHLRKQSMLDDMQVTKEEMQSVKEELQSLNEELESSNVELSASMEEMQKRIKELEAVNDEMQIKMTDYLVINNDMNNFLNSTKIATLFLDKNLHIRKFTTDTTSLIKLIETDIGRPFTDIVHNLIYPELYEDAKKVLSSLKILKKEVQTKDNLWFSLRIEPYYKKSKWVDGLVMTFVDITALKRSELKLRYFEQGYKFVTQLISRVIIKLSDDFKVLEFNPHAEIFFDKKHEEVINKNFIQMFIPESEQKKTENYLKKKVKENTNGKYTCQVIMANGKIEKIEWIMEVLSGAFQEESEIVLISNIIEL